MKLLLISPNNPYNIFRAPQMLRMAGRISKHMQVRSVAAFPGLNLAILAALTPPQVETQIVDESVEPIELENDADLVGITAMTNM